MSVPLKSFPTLPQQNYQNIRADIRTGDILLCSGSAVFSKLIQKATKCIWSHVAFVVRLDSMNRIMVLESVESFGVRTVPLSFYVNNYNGSNKGYPGRLLLARHDDIKDVSITRMHKMSQFAIDLFGYPYDNDEIIRIAARVGKSLFGFTKNEVKRDREYICSEYAWECFNKIGIKIDYDKRGFVAPKDFARAGKVKPVAVII